MRRLREHSGRESVDPSARLREGGQGVTDPRWPPHPSQTACADRVGISTNTLARRGGQDHVARDGHPRAFSGREDGGRHPAEAQRPASQAGAGLSRHSPKRALEKSYNRPCVSWVLNANTCL